MIKCNRANKIKKETNNKNANLIDLFDIRDKILGVIDNKKANPKIN